MAESMSDQREVLNELRRLRTDLDHLLRRLERKVDGIAKKVGTHINPGSPG